MSSTLEKLEDLLSKTKQHQTLAVWRLSDEKLVDTLKLFATDRRDEDSDYTKMLEQTQGLFNRLNPLLAQQEREDEHFSSSFSAMESVGKNEFSVVFGGKYTLKPKSISETLVAILAHNNSRVYTVSRSPPSPGLPQNLKHFQSENLDSDELGKGEFLKVLNQARDEWQESYYNTTMVIYFTIGFHKGENPYERNIFTARNFGDALVKSFSSIGNNSWRVVVTGTDATRPTTYEDATFRWKGENSINLTVPSYKIHEGNYIYAMSKLGQIYTVASAVAKLSKDRGIHKKLKPTIERIEKTVKMVKEGDNSYAYLVEISKRTGRLRKLCGRMKMKDKIYLKTELNGISKYVQQIEESLGKHFLLAEGISICYTSLHSEPWTEKAITTDDPRYDILRNIITRLKNAISLEHAAALHFPMVFKQHSSLFTTGPVR